MFFSSKTLLVATIVLANSPVFAAPCSDVDLPAIDASEKSLTALNAQLQSAPILLDEEKVFDMQGSADEKLVAIIETLAQSYCLAGFSFAATVQQLASDPEGQIYPFNGIGNEIRGTMTTLDFLLQSEEGQTLAQQRGWVDKAYLEWYRKAGM
ncbi:hypothetical protein [Motilimonas pumila]|uniref:Uncharacterized protein n=1 Tax=Motilimonas pumila TaxID=2303987 RepID=A0A418YCK5_9GAMM|nr:hypothetical protein [Motilimonas pumila]RJG42192.1 hypothetical protein D1Z90_14715 [Motilimonas pumila]